MKFEEAILEIKKGNKVFRKSAPVILDVCLDSIKYFTIQKEDVLSDDWEIVK